MIGQVKLIEYPGNRQSIKLHQNTQILHDFAHNFILSAHCHVCSLADLGGGRAGRTPPPTGPNSFIFTYISFADLGGACPVHAPPMGPNSFIFAYIFTEKCPRWRSTPPMGACPPYRKSWICHCIFTKKCPCWGSTPPNAKSWIHH